MKRPDFVKQEDWKKLVVTSIKFGIDPYLLVAIGLHETGWGTHGWGTHGYILGVGCFNEKEADPSLKGFNNQIEWAAEHIADFLPFHFFSHSLLLFAQYIWKPGNPSLWALSVWKIYTDLINKWAPEVPLCQAPPGWVRPVLILLFQSDYINTPYGDFDWYRACQLVYNVLMVEHRHERG